MFFEEINDAINAIEVEERITFAFKGGATISIYKPDNSNPFDIVALNNKVNIAIYKLDDGVHAGLVFYAKCRDIIAIGV